MFSNVKNTFAYLGSEKGNEMLMSQYTGYCFDKTEYLEIQNATL